MSVDIIDGIVAQNLGVYRAAPSRLQEDVSQEAQVASDYRGRLVYELLQNADDAMAEDDGAADCKVAFVVNDDELWISNSGRALTESDVQGLCGLGASSKVDAHGTRRASIGHKGLGFKSVLEITNSPAVYSEEYSFELGPQQARSQVNQLWGQLGLPAPPAVPFMRFPARLRDTPGQWARDRAAHFNTGFRFPFRGDLGQQQRASLSDLLVNLPLTTVLFLKHLQRVDVSVSVRGDTVKRWWEIRRDRADDGAWHRVRGLSASGLYRVAVEASDGPSAAFLVAHDADVQIDEHRLGLSGPAWEGVAITEVSVAAAEAEMDHPMPAEWRRFHVFLPTTELSPYPLLVNGAFATDLSRQHVKVASDSRDYNSHLIRSAARLFKRELVPTLLQSGPAAVLAAMDRGAATSVAGGTAAELFHVALVDEIADVQLLPTERGDTLRLGETVLPPAILGDDGGRYREALPEEPGWDERTFPTAEFCNGRWASVAADHGAYELTPAESLGVLGALCDPHRAAVVDDESGGFERDPVLELCTMLWERAGADDRATLEVAARSSALFPVHRNSDRTLERCALNTETAFYPPRKAHHDLPLKGLRFMSHSLCWGALKPQERAEVLGERMKAWTALFQVNEFRFEEVMRAAVLPALVLGTDPADQALLESLKAVKPLAAICQLAGRFTKPDRPLRYQRLKSDRALFNLSRLPVPCRGHDGEERWLPAYRVYLGADWIGDDSVERIAEAVAAGSPGVDEPQFEYLAAPDRFLGTLLDYAGARADSEAGDDAEVGLDEDTDEAIETDERARWLSFLSWIGVNGPLRLVHFHDVEDGNSGWLTTRGLAQPLGRAFSHLGSTWTDFSSGLRKWLLDRPDHDDVVAYLYEAHDLDGIVPLLLTAERDASKRVGKSLFEHLVRHWKWYAGFTEVQLALVPITEYPNRRSSPPRAGQNEIKLAGDDLWMFRLKQRGFCPTSHGPRRAAATWQPSPEMERRFGRRGQTSGRLFPILDVAATLPAPSVRGLCERLGIRGEISPSTFHVADAQLMCSQLKTRYADTDEAQVDASQLRAVIKPAYREMFELLSGTRPPTSGEPPLCETPLLADTASGLRFVPAHQVLFASTPGIRERSGVSGSVPIFVIDAEPSARAPLSRLFGVRVLEDVLEWDPHPGESPFDDSELAEVRAGMRSLVPPLLARMRVERAENRTETRDRRTLLAFANCVEPVDELELACRLDGRPLDHVSNRPYFVSVSPEGRLIQAFVVWEGPPWPPTAEVAQGLAMALADALGVNLVETFMAFIQSDASQRERLLQIAGAAGLVQEITEELAETESGPAAPPESDELAPTPSPEADEASDETPAPQPTGRVAPSAPPVPLLRFEDLMIEGDPIMITGEPASGEEPDGRDGHNRSPSPAAGRVRAAPGTDLDALDRLGMNIALGYELRRLQRKDIPGAQILASADGATVSTSLVVDVHSPEAIQLAEQSSSVVKTVMEEMQSKGISRLYPGFDILTIANGEPDRLIELKSSGVDARVQVMSWNEWKSARSSSMRGRFWLYLVGNLRADLANSQPFVRAIHDPFGSLAAHEFEEQSTSRAVQLRVREFDEAEHLNLEVRVNRRASSSGGQERQTLP